MLIVYLNLALVLRQFYFANDNAGIEPALTNVSAFISYCPAMSTATDDQSANLAPGLLALSHVRSTTIDFIGATYRTLLS